MVEKHEQHSYEFADDNSMRFNSYRNRADVIPIAHPAATTIVSLIMFALQTVEAPAQQKGKKQDNAVSKRVTRTPKLTWYLLPATISPEH
jgi:hypothetical protein